MLTKRQNLMETIKGGNPDRFVNQYEFLEIIMEAPLRTRPKPGETITNEWGITYSWPKDQLGAFPIHDEAHMVLKDITRWKETVKAPSVEFSDERWAPAIAHAIHNAAGIYLRTLPMTAEKIFMTLMEKERG